MRWNRLHTWYSSTWQAENSSDTLYHTGDWARRQPENSCARYDLIQSGWQVSEYLTNGSLYSQIVSALEYCHFNLIVHRDLKPENLLLDENENIKITDFGLANFITPNNKFSTFCGSLHYGMRSISTCTIGFTELTFAISAAPEILNGHQYAGPAVDIYALGVILYCLVRIN